MPERHANAGRHQLCDEPRRHDLRRQGDQQNSLARRSQDGEVVRARPPDAARVVHAGLFGRQKRPLEVKPEHAWLPTDREVGRVQRKFHFFRAVGYERRQQACRAGFSMRRRDGANALHGRLIVEQNIAAAVDLQIDEAGGQPCALGQGANGNGPRQVRRRHEVRDASTVHDHGGALAHVGPVEHMVRGYCVQRRFAHLVSVTFCRCRGRSTSVPRRCATRIASG